MKEGEALWWRRFGSLPEEEGAEAIYNYRLRRLDDEQGPCRLEPPGDPQRLKQMGFMGTAVGLYKQYLDLLALRGLTRENITAHKGPLQLHKDGHWLGAGMADLASEAHLWRGEYKEALVAAQNRKAFIRRIFGSSLSFEAAVATSTEAVATAMLGDSSGAATLFNEALKEASAWKTSDDAFLRCLRDQFRELKQRHADGSLPRPEPLLERPQKQDRRGWRMMPPEDPRRNKSYLPMVIWQKRGLPPKDALLSKGKGNNIRGLMLDNKKNNPPKLKEPYGQF